jgi:hypothetical protein
MARRDFKPHEFGSPREDKSMNKVFVATAAAVLLSPIASPAARAQQSEIAELRAQLHALQARIEELEKRQALPREAPPSAATHSAPASHSATPDTDWTERLRWTGDLRFRNETIDQQLVPEKRNRYRVRARAGLIADVTDSLRAEVRVSGGEAISGFPGGARSGNGDARSADFTLDDVSSRKRMGIDLAYLQWSPDDRLNIALGKMRQPWLQPRSALFFDEDVNPEGATIGWRQGMEGLFATAFHMQLAERAGAADSTLSGAQIGWRADIASRAHLTFAAAYYDHGAVKGFPTVQNEELVFNAFGNVVSVGNCEDNYDRCFANDFNIAEVFTEVGFDLWGAPLTLFAEYARNTAAQGAPFNSRSRKLDTAYAAGFQYSDPAARRGWQLGYLYQNIQNDALFAQWVDSDFAGGVTGSKGHVFRLGYGFARNISVDARYFLTDTNIDLPFTVLPGTPALFDRRYELLQVDVSTRF